MRKENLQDHHQKQKVEREISDMIHSLFILPGERIKPVCLVQRQI